MECVMCVNLIAFVCITAIVMISEARKLLVSRLPLRKWMRYTFFFLYLLRCFIFWFHFFFFFFWLLMLFRSTASGWYVRRLYIHDRWPFPFRTISFKVESTGCVCLRYVVNDTRFHLRRWSWLLFSFSFWRSFR